MSPNGQVVLDVGNLFGVQLLLQGHLELTADAGIATTETFSNSQGMATVAGQGTIAAGSDGHWTISFPYIANGNGRWTGLSYANLGTTPATVQLQLFSDSGAPIGYSQMLLPAKAEQAATVDSLANAYAGNGYAVVRSDQPLAGL